MLWEYVSFCSDSDELWFIIGRLLLYFKFVDGGINVLLNFKLKILIWKFYFVDNCEVMWWFCGVVI